MKPNKNNAMKQAKITLIMLLGLLVSLDASAQSVVTGSNLNIGSNNTLTESGTTYHGNAVGQNHCLNGAHSLAVGQNDSILEGSQSSVALGTYNRIIGNGSVAFGNGVKIQGQRNIGLGNEVKALGTSRSQFFRICNPKSVHTWFFRICNPKAVNISICNSKSVRERCFSQ